MGTPSPETHDRIHEKHGGDGDERHGEPPPLPTAYLDDDHEADTGGQEAETATWRASRSAHGIRKQARCRHRTAVCPPPPDFSAFRRERAARPSRAGTAPA